MQRTFRYTKLKVVVGYLLLLILSIAAIFLIYQQITHLEVEEEGENKSDRKLYMIGNTMAELYEAETLSQVFLQTNSVNSFKKYLHILEKVDAHIDSLKELTNQSAQLIRLDSVSRLLEKKTQNLKTLIQVKQSLIADEFYQKAITHIQSKKDSVQKHKEIRHRMVTTLDSSFVKTEKKKRNFWSWFTSKPAPDTTLQVTISHHSIVDTLNGFTSGQNTDTIVNALKLTWEKLQQKNEDITQKISLAEYRITEQSAHISKQLRRILGEYEKEELDHSFQKIAKREKAVNVTITRIAWISAGSVLLILLFIFFILRDISSGQRYRKELESAKKYTDRLLESREKLMLTVTHDIKSPLGSIIGYIELLCNTPTNERQRYFLKNMQSSAEHILHLVTNLLDFTKLENNQMPIEEISYHPAQLLQEICDSFMPLAHHKKLKLSSHISPELNHHSQGDALRIRQITANLLSNAIKYTDNGSVDLTASIDSSRQQIILEIKDTGSGMTQDEQMFIFKEFTRLKSHATIEGTGLGLPITLKLIQLLRGEIKLDSAPGKGSCFTVRLPFVPTQTDEKPLAASPALSPAIKELLPIERLHILMVDDDPLQLEMASDLLRNQGIRTEITTQPETVIEKLQTDSYDLVLSDIQMPKMNGFELIKNIRESALPIASILPVVALSADSGKTKEDYLQAGFSAYLAKPFTSTQLVEVIAHLTGSIPPTIKHLVSTPKIPQTEGYTLKHILRFTDNDEESLKKIIQSFVTETEQHLALLKEYQAKEQKELSAKLAHKMLPIFRQLETQQIIEFLQLLEQQEKYPLSPNELETTILTVTQKIEELIRRLKEECCV